MRSLAFGEILWDISGSGRTLGGAPLNVAGHIVRLGGQAMIVSALGNDSLGHDAAAALDGEAGARAVERGRACGLTNEELTEMLALVLE